MRLTYPIALSFWSRATKTASPGCQKRFVATMVDYTESAYQQVVNRATDDSFDIDAFIAWRRESSAVRPIWAVVEFSLGLDLPDDVMQHPILQQLAVLANDIVGLSNVSKPPSNLLVIHALTVLL